ncbi:hypothetical protein [Streptosporangium sp. 'caverna']|uniref:hypothetical protein n=1 Tax=Streptosporangium sp. 'caverna' TaxID=2202249 RepID=UPI00195511CD|nr:hypothetical protein [Streptosporangium sp. 'caverna']
MAIASPVDVVALQAHRTPGIHATEIAGNARHIFAVTYGEPPDPPATTAVLNILGPTT